MSMKFDDSGLKKLSKRLNEISSDANKLNGTYQVGEAFNSEFMQKYTNFGSIDAFFEASPFTIKNEQDLNNIDEAELDSFVNSVSSFDTWNELKNKAGELYIAKKLGF